MRVIVLPVLAILPFLFWYMAINAPYQEYDTNYAYWFYAIILSFANVILYFIFLSSNKGTPTKFTQLLSIIYITLNNPFSVIIVSIAHMQWLELSWKV